MWEQYETPEEKRENAASSSPDPSPPHDTDQPPTISVFPPGVPRSRPTRDSSGAGVVGGVVAALVAVGISATALAANSSGGAQDHSGFHDCVAEQEAGDPGLLSPAEICEIGNERPTDYVDDYEYDPFGDSGLSDSYGDAGYDY